MCNYKDQEVVHAYSYMLNLSLTSFNLNAVGLLIYLRPSECGLRFTP